MPILLFVFAMTRQVRDASGILVKITLRVLGFFNLLNFRSRSRQTYTYFVCEWMSLFDMQAGCLLQNLASTPDLHIVRCRRFKVLALTWVWTVHKGSLSSVIVPSSQESIIVYQTFSTDPANFVFSRVQALLDRVRVSHPRLNWSCSPLFGTLGIEADVWDLRQLRWNFSSFHWHILHAVQWVVYFDERFLSLFSYQNSINRGYYLLL